MAKRTSKTKSVDQEEHIARVYGGERVRGSGAVANRPGDVWTPTTLFECKTTGDPVKPGTSHPIKLATLEKIADEAWSVGKEPALAIRIHAPGSVLANHRGDVDIVVRLVKDDERYQRTNTE